MYFYRKKVKNICIYKKKIVFLHGFYAHVYTHARNSGE